MKPSEKNPGCSPTSPRPPRRRESIADHLVGAKARVALRGVGWTDKLATPAFVADLIKKEIINGPESHQKTVGVGKAQRFLPRDYRDLLDVINLKSQGVKHKSAWISHLWLRGHDYPIERFRAALLAEVKSFRKTALEDYAPRGRLSTKSFSERFDERVRKRPEDSLAPETTDIFEPLAALMMRPQAVGEVVVDVPRAAELVQSMFENKIDGLEETLGELFDAFRTGATTISPDTESRLRDMIAQTPLAGFVEYLENDVQAQQQFAEIPARLRGTLDDGRNGAETSALINTVKKASDEAFMTARKWYTGVRSGDIEAKMRAAIPDVTPQDAAILNLLADGARVNRQIISTNPKFAIHMFVNFVHTEVPASLLTAATPRDVRAFIAELRGSQHE